MKAVSQPATLHCSTIIILPQNNQVHSFLSQHGISANFPFPHCDFLPLQFVSLLFVNSMYLGPPNGTRVIKTNYDDFWYARFGFLFCFYAHFRGKKNYYV